jgi:hypothetical protein
VKTGSVRKFASSFVTIGAVGVVVAGFMASPVAAVAATATPMTHISSNYATVSRAPQLPSGTRNLGAASATKTISGAVALAPRNPAALQRAAAEVSNPRSPNYRHYIAKGAFAAQFGPTTATINAVKSTLAASHLAVTSVSGNGLLVHFTGSVAAADSAFRTTIANVRLANGRTGIETTKPLSFPASIAHQVTSVIGLDTLLRPATTLEHATHPAAVKPVTHKLPAAAPGAPSACAAASAGASAFGGLTDDQIAHSYGVDGLYKAGDTGAGQTIAVFELEPFSTTDLAAFDTCYYGATQAAAMASRLSVTNVDGGSGTGEGSGESILDVDDVSGLAPGANIHVYEAPNTNTGSMDMYNEIVQSDTAQVISTSWAFCEQDEINLEPGYINVENDVFQQAALQGQTLFASSGDAGSDACAYHATVPFAPTLSTSDPASQPFVTGVGGTTITNAKNTPTEQVWNDGSIGGGAGGGVSSVWGAPAWQQGFLDTAAASSAVTAGLTPCSQSANGGLCREVPDVSAQADEYTGGISVYAAEFGGWTTFGGTSSSTPLWAAMTADINASSGCVANGRVGFASPALYAVASVPAEYAASFNDVTAGNNDVYDLFNGALFAAHTGYDMGSGLGTPELTTASGGAGLAANLCALSAPSTPAPAISSVSPATVSASPSGSLTVNGTHLTGVSKLSIGGFNVPAANWSVNGGGTAITVTTIPSATQVGTGSQGPQDGTGRAIVSVTDPTSGESSAINAAATLLYVKSTTSSVPSVDGVAPFGGATAGGNTVTVWGSGFTNSGPDAITHVTIGGVDASAFTVLTDSKLSVTIPAMTGGTVCLGSDDKTRDVCQAQLVVTNANGSSTTSTILPPYSGAPFLGISGGLPAPACVTGSSCEIVPATSEYDYLVAPSITSITTTSAGDPIAYASENGTTIATIKGSGFDYLGFDWVNIGNPTVSANADFGTVNITPTEIQVAIPGREFSHKAIVTLLSVQTLQGLSAGSPFSYAPIPQVTSVAPQFGPDTGGTSIAVKGTGFTATDGADGGMLAYQYVEFGVSTNQLSGYSVTSDTALTATTPQNNPGAFSVQACTVTGCSFPTSQTNFDNTLFDFFQPGAPVVTSVSKKTGPASGGTQVVIHGQNLADAVEVVFGKTVAESANAPEILTNGSSTEVDAIAPPGKAGTKVNIQVVTVESLSTRSASPPTAAATFTYKASAPSAPQDVTAHQAATTLTVKWKTPASNGGHAITGYRVSAISLPNSDKKGAKKPPTVVVTTKAGARTAKLTKLRGGWGYEVEVQAINSLGRGLPGSPPLVYFITDPA